MKLLALLFALVGLVASAQAFVQPLPAAGAALRTAASAKQVTASSVRAAAADLTVLSAKKGAVEEETKYWEGEYLLSVDTASLDAPSLCQTRFLTTNPPLPRSSLLVPRTTT